MKCSVSGCGRPTVARLLCSMHYQRQARTGTPGPARRLDRTGNGNANWRGGRIRGGTDGRYWMRHVPSHPAANPLGYVLEHRLVMEAHLGRYLTAEEVVHHRNGDPGDNRLANLELLSSQAEHVRLHAKGTSH